MLLTGKTDKVKLNIGKTLIYAILMDSAKFRNETHLIYFAAIVASI
jgi:hypothetical protein